MLKLCKIPHKALHAFDSSSSQATEHLCVIAAERDAPTNREGAQRFSQATDELDQTNSDVVAEKSNSTSAESNQQSSVGSVESLTGVDGSDLAAQIGCSDQAQATDQGATVSGKEEVIGREMYITASFFNHSCEPNCVKTRKQGSAQGIAAVTALRDIQVSAPTLGHPHTWLRLPMCLVVDLQTNTDF